MSMKTIKRLSARIMKVGVSRVKINEPTAAKEALTAEDVRQLILKKAIESKPIKSIGRLKAKLKGIRSQDGRRRGPGSKKGTGKAIMTDKDKWMIQIRSQRKLLFGYKHQLLSTEYRRIYRMIKGNSFKSRKQLLLSIQKSVQVQKDQKVV